MYLAPLNNGVVFRKLFTDREILVAFVKDLIGIEIEPETIEAEKSFFPAIGPIDFKIDIFVEDPKHRLILEIQRVRYDYHYDRFLHYHNAAIIELQSGHRDYRLNRTVYTIVWLTSKDAEHPKSLITTMLRSVAEDGTVLGIYPHKLFFLNPNYISEETPAGLRDWMQLVQESIRNPQRPDINVRRPIIQKASGLIEDDQLTGRERALMKEEVGYESHLRLRWDEGRKEGRDEGLREGMEKGKKAIALSMLKEGLDVQLICKVTGLSPAAIEQLGAGGAMDG